MASEKIVKRILLKLSGEALTGEEAFGIDPKVLDQLALEVGQLVGIGVQVGLVVGGGNLFRGKALQASRARQGDRRSHGHAGYCDECLGAAGCPRAFQYRNPGYVGHSYERRR